MRSYINHHVFEFQLISGGEKLFKFWKSHLSFYVFIGEIMLAFLPES